MVDGTRMTADVIRGTLVARLLALLAFLLHSGRRWIKLLRLARLAFLKLRADSRLTGHTASRTSPTRASGSSSRDPHFLGAASLTHLVAQPRIKFLSAQSHSFGASYAVLLAFLLRKAVLR